MLADLADLFETLRTWPGVAEREPGVFYLRGQPFLHFHLVTGRQRRADVKGTATWAHLHLPRPLDALSRRALVRELQRRYAEKSVAPSRSRPRPRRSAPRR